MTGNRYYTHMRKSIGSPSKYKFSLQSAVAAFVSDYVRYAGCSFPGSERRTRRRRKLTLTDESIHVGIHLGTRIKWDVTYLSLKVNEELKLDFLICIKYSVCNYQNLPERHEKVFMCSVWATGNHLAFTLAEQEGTQIRHFWFDNQLTQDVFQPVVTEIQKHIHAENGEMFSPHNELPQDANQEADVLRRISPSNTDILMEQ